VSVYRTGDGGAHWRRRLFFDGSTFGGIPFTTIKFFKGGKGLVPITFGGVEQPLLFRTTNGGASWHRSAFLSSRAFGNGYLMTFADSKHGWLKADMSAGAGTVWFSLYRTVDTGRHWIKVAWMSPPGRSSSVAVTGTENSLSFRNRAVGWLAGSDSGEPELYLSTDGGRHWRPQRVPALPGHSTRSPASEVADAPQFYSRRSGVLPLEAFLPKGRGGSWRVFLYSSNDGGLHWVRPRKVPGGSVNVFEMKDAGHWWIGAGRTVWRSHNRGRSWKTGILPISNGSLGSLQFVDDRHGWAAAQSNGSSNGTINGVYRTVDGGIQWRKVQLPGRGG
jgi:photosystem II stability/assembly factor-like uncharacterized protein